MYMHQVEHIYMEHCTVSIDEELISSCQHIWTYMLVLFIDSYCAGCPFQLTMQCTGYKVSDLTLIPEWCSQQYSREFEQGEDTSHSDK